MNRSGNSVTYAPRNVKASTNRPRTSYVSSGDWTDQVDTSVKVTAGKTTLTERQIRQARMVKAYERKEQARLEREAWAARVANATAIKA